MARSLSSVSRAAYLVPRPTWPSPLCFGRRRGSRFTHSPLCLSQTECTLLFAEFSESQLSETQIDFPQPQTNCSAPAYTRDKRRTRKGETLPPPRGTALGMAHGRSQVWGFMWDVASAGASSSHADHSQLSAVETTPLVVSSSFTAVVATGARVFNRLRVDCRKSRGDQRRGPSAVALLLPPKAELLRLKTLSSE